MVAFTYQTLAIRHTIVKVSDIEHVPRYQLVVGSSNESGDMDGVVSSATLHSPHGLETFGRTLFVCDSGNKAIRMITNAKPFKKLSDVFYKYAELFNLDHYRGPPRFSFDQGISIIDNVVAFLLTWGEETRERTGRTATQGPDQIIPHCTRRSFQLIHSSLVKLKNLLTELGEEDLVNQILFSALTTLIVENFFSLMRQQDSMPTQLEYGIRRAACIREVPRVIILTKCLTLLRPFHRQLSMQYKVICKIYLLKRRKLYVNLPFHLDEAFASIP